MEHALSHLSSSFVALPLAGLVKGLGGVLIALRMPRRNRSSAPGSSLISGFLGDLAMEPTFRLAGSDHTFTPIGGPLDDPQRSQLLEDIGRAIMGWARFEYLVTTIAIHVNKQEANAALHDPDPSAKMSSLIKLVQKWITRHPPYAALAPAFDNRLVNVLLEDIKNRNALAHSLLEAVDADTRTLTLRRLKRDGKDEWSACTLTIDLELPSRLAAQANLASRHLVELCKVLFPQDQTP